MRLGLCYYLVAYTRVQLFVTSFNKFSLLLVTQPEVRTFLGFESVLKLAKF